MKPIQHSILYTRLWQRSPKDAKSTLRHCPEEADDMDSEVTMVDEAIHEVFCTF